MMSLLEGNVTMNRFVLSSFLFVIAVSSLSAQSETPFYKKKYDPKSDPAVDLRKAIDVASTSGQDILLEVGGEWCVWCHRLDSLFEKNPDLTDFLVKNYLVLKINVSQENKNEPFLSGFSEIEGYPHLFVLDSNGKLVHSQDTGALEEGKRHSRDKVMAFLQQWAPNKHKNNTMVR